MLEVKHVYSEKPSLMQGKAVGQTQGESRGCVERNGKASGPYREKKILLGPEPCKINQNIL